MQEDNGRLSIEVGINLNTLKQDAETAKQLLNSIGASAVQQGSVIDSAFSESSAAHGFSVLEAAIQGVSTEIKEMNFGSAQEKIGALSYIIEQNEQVLAENTQQLEKWKNDAKDAFSSGNASALAAATANIDAQTQKVSELAKETESYKNILEAVKIASGMESQSVDVPKLFDSEAEMQQVDALRARIQQLQAEIQNVGASGGNTLALTAELSQTKDELHEIEVNAANAAASLGSDLGGRAAEAQQELYALNNAIKEQQELIDTISSALAEAEASYNALATTEGASTEEVERAAATYNSLSESLSNAQQKMAALEGMQEQAKSQWQNVSNEINMHDNIMVKMLGGYDNYQKIVTQLPQPLQSVIGGMQGMTGAAKAFIATPLGAVLAAIVLAFQAVKTWLNSTVEGQMKLAEISGYVGGVLGQLKEIVITVGKALFNAFSNPKQAISDLWKAIKENVVNRFKAVGEIAGSLGKVIKAAFTLDTDGIKSGLKELTDGFLKFGTGVDKLTDKVSKYAKSVTNAAAENAKIAKESKQLEIDESEWSRTKQSNATQKAKLMGDMRDMSKSVAERKKASEAYKKIVEDEYKKDAEIADKKVELQKRSMALTSNTIEDENKLRELQRNREAVSTNRQQQLAMTQRMDGRFTNMSNRATGSSNNSETQRLQQEKQQRENAQKQIGEAEAKLMLDNENRQLAIMEDGHEKRMEAISINRKRELAKLKEEQKKFVELNKTAGEATGEDGLTNTQRDLIEKSRLGIEKEYQRGMQDVLSSELDDIMTYEQKRTQIQEEFAKKRESLYEKDADGNVTSKLREGVTQGNVDELNRQSEEALKTVDEQFASRSETYEAWCNELTNETLRQLKEMLTQAEAELKKAEKAGGATAEQRAKVSKLKATISKEEAKINTSPDKRSVKEWGELQKVLNETANQFKGLGEQIGGTAGEVLSSAGTITTSTVAMINGILSLVQGSTIATEGMSRAAVTAIKTVETASVILAVISAALQVATAIANLFSSDKAREKERESLQTRIDQLQWEIDHAGDLKMFETDVTPLEMIKQAAYDATEEIRQLGRELSKSQERTQEYRMKLYEYSQNEGKAYEKTIEAIVEHYADMAYMQNKLTSKDTFANSRQQLEKYAKQLEDLKDQYDTIDGKDKDKVEKQKTEVEQNMVEVTSKMEAVINDMLEDIMGGSFQDLASELGDALFDAFKDGEDAAKAWGDKVNDIVGEIMKKMIIQQYLEEPMGKLFDKYRERLFPNGDGSNAISETLSAWQELSDELNGLRDNVEQGLSYMPEDMVKTLWSSESEREGASKGIASASQESIDELNGRMTAVQGHTFDISANTKIIMDTTNDILTHVANIDDSTATMKSDIRKMKSDISDMNTRGIKIN